MHRTKQKTISVNMSSLNDCLVITE